MKKTALVAFFLVALLSGCEFINSLLGSNPYVGTWATSFIFDEDYWYFTFNDDGTFLEDVYDMWYGEWSHETGSYDVEESKITLHYSSGGEPVSFSASIAEEFLHLTVEEDGTLITVTFKRATRPTDFDAVFSETDGTDDGTGDGTDVVDDPVVVTPADLTIVSSSLVMDYYLQLHVTFRNDGEKTITAAKIAASFEDAFGDPVENYGDTFFNGYFDSRTILPGATDGPLAWSLFSWDSASTITDIFVYEIAYSDGTTWEDTVTPH